jgi:hypothetical protein
MAFADDILPTLTAIRAIPGQFGLRPHAVSLVYATSSGDHTGDGDVLDEDTPITEADSQPPKVRWLKDEEITVGNLASGSVEIGPITPAFSTGGTDLTTITGQLDRGMTRFLRITGPKHPDGALYEITQVKADRSLNYKIQAKPVSYT